jgi:tRNA pseudouridine13 synthase
MTGVQDILDTIKIKHRREDFCVTEALALEPPLPIHASAENGGAGFYRYWRLKKSGFTTFQAIEKTAELLGLPPAAVTYCGLKDEDGITDQMIAMPVDAGAVEFQAGRSIVADGRSHIEIVPYGTYPAPLEIGGLVGNAFRICVRSVPVSMREQLDKLAGANPAWFVNYYDTQRFGVPGGRSAPPDRPCASRRGFRHGPRPVEECQHGRTGKRP